MDDEQVIARS